jgi:hypothetical protein
MNRYKKLLILLPIVFGFIAAVLLFWRKTPTSVSPIPQSSQELNTTLSIGEKSFDVSQFVGKSALEATQHFAEVLTKGAGENAFITAIDGKVAYSKKHEFWELVINGKPAEVGAGSYVIQKGDSISWRLSTY